MNAFDKGFAQSDADIFLTMPDGDLEVLANGTRLLITAVEQPVVVTGAYFSGGRGDFTSYALEVPSKPLIDAGIQSEGFTVIWKNRTLLVRSITWQGGTASLTVGSQSEAAEF